MKLHKNILTIVSALFFCSFLSSCTFAEVSTDIESEAPGEEIIEDIEEEEIIPEVKLLENYFDRAPLNYTLFMRPHDVKGIYVSANIAGIDSYLDPLIELCKETEINAMVIDVKSDFGTVTFQGMPYADELGISTRTIPDIHALIAKLKENDIYPIARVVCFKDNEGAKLYPDIYIADENGDVWRDNSDLKNAWMNPYNRDSWNYIVRICKDIAAVGFKEIQFDYIRFDTSSRLKTADFGDTFDLSRTDIITSFVKYAVKELKPLGVVVSADVYGTIINSDVDAGIVGQDYAELSRHLDVICPMIYPSHYANNSMNIPVPDLDPYQTIYKSLLLSNARLDNIEQGEHRAVVRPWLQDFTASWLKPHLSYTGKERGLQIQAVKDSGYEQWLLWDAAVKYDKEGVAPND